MTAKMRQKWGFAMSRILKIRVDDTLVMKKKHPCGSNEFRVIRVGSDVRIICCGCGRDLTLPREKLEKAVKKIIHSEEEDISNG